jgi:predicted Zn-dependent protease
VNAESFFALGQRLFANLIGAEVAFLWLEGETSSFVRINRGKVRQPGDVEQHAVTLSLLRGARQVRANVTIAGRGDADLPALVSTLSELRGLLDVVPDDPFATYDTNPRESVESRESPLPDPAAATGFVLEAARGLDFVGIWASGSITRALASSLGHRLFRTTHSFALDYSVYANGDKASKGSYAGTAFEPTDVEARIARASAELEILRRPERKLGPGKYRVFLTPSALSELTTLLSYDAFGEKSHRTKQTPLLSMLEEGATLDARVTLAENADAGVAPHFLPMGFARPRRSPLIEKGKIAGTLVSPRSAREYGGAVNVGDFEAPSSLDMAAGDLRTEDIMPRLGTGIYVPNLWYANYSDAPRGRITAMTRFATLWVEDGVPVAPLAVLRFDDTLFNLLGSELEALTADREWRLDTSTYGGRGTSSVTLPGALIRGMTFTL